MILRQKPLLSSMKLFMPRQTQHCPVQFPSTSTKVTPLSWQSLPSSSSFIYPRRCRGEQQKRQMSSYYLRERFLSRSLPNFASQSASLASSPTPSLPPSSMQHQTLLKDLNVVIGIVQKYDPSGYLPGILLPSSESRVGYFVARALWVESGLRFRFFGDSGGFLDDNKHVSGVDSDVIDWAEKYDIGNIDGRLKFWKDGLDSLFYDVDSVKNNNNNSSNSRDGIDHENEIKNRNLWKSHPTLRLLHYLYTSSPSPSSFSSILHSEQSRETIYQLIGARNNELKLRQYPTTDSLIQHCHETCSGLLSLVLECAGVPPPLSTSIPRDINQQNSLGSTTVKDNGDDNNNELAQRAHNAARHFGVTHGIANALRMAIVTASSVTSSRNSSSASSSSSSSSAKSNGSYSNDNQTIAGRIILPQDLCDKHSLQRPRYVLSALSMGDEECKRKLGLVVKDMVDIARSSSRIGYSYLVNDNDDDSSSNDSNNINNSTTVTKSIHAKQIQTVFLPVLASETFLNRLEHQSKFDLTNRSLRNVTLGEHAACAWNMVRFWLKG